MKRAIKWICPVMLFCFSCGTVSDKGAKVDFARLTTEKKDSFWKSELYHDSILVRMLCESKKYMALVSLNRLKEKKVTEAASTYKSGFIFRKYNNKFNFSMFRVDSIYRGKPAKPDFKNFSGNTAGFDLYRDEYIGEYKKRKVNFAGHYTIIEVSCGSMCQCVCVVDRISGKIYEHSSFDTSDGHYGIRYKTDSRMIIIDSGLLDEAESRGLEGYYDAQYAIRPSTYEWKDSVFVKID